MRFDCCIIFVILQRLSNFFTVFSQECYDCREYYCGIDAITKAISMLTSAGCPRESLNWCCFLHDTCYDRNKHYIPFMRGCDYQFGDCIHYYYQTNPLCSNWLYSTHAEATKIFGEAHKLKLHQETLIRPDGYPNG